MENKNIIYVLKNRFTLTVPLTMKISFTLLFCVFLQLNAATGYAQRTRKSMNNESNVTIGKVLNEIERNSDYVFLYSDRTLNTNRIVSVKTKNRDIRKILNELFHGTNITYNIVDKQIILRRVQNGASPVMISQQQQHPATNIIKGCVKDARGESIIGASVIDKNNPDRGVITDIDGHFQMNIPVGNTLKVTYVGYKSVSFIVKPNLFTYNIILREEPKALNEIIVVGYGVQKKASITGSVAAVKGDELKKSGSLNISNSFAGRIPGVIASNRSGEPGSDWSDILIRGKGTLNDNSPLIVIDGVANRSGMERLNPNDIESVSVLKDASAAIYGAEAANGVILITTKSGKNSKPIIEYDGTIGLSQNTRTPKLLNAYEWMVYDDEIKTHLGQTPLWQNIKKGYLDGTINRKKYGDTDWMKVIFRDLTPQTRHSISLRGGNEDVKYYIAGDLTYQKPAYRNTIYNFRTNQVRINLNAKVSKSLTIGINTSVRNENRYDSPISTSSIFWEAFMAYPYLYDYYPNGLPGPGISWGNNLAILTSGKHVGYDKIDDFFLNSKFDFNLKLDCITKGLYVSGFGAFDRHERHEKRFADVWDTYNYDEVNDVYVKQTTNADDNIINLSQSDLKGYVNTYHIQFGYERLFGNHKIGGFIAYEQSKNKGDEFDAWRGYYLSDQLAYLNYGGDKDKTNSGYGSISARQNIFGRLNYDYMGKYLFEFTLRRDGSMNFARHHRWGTFPGVSVGWRISEESFMSKLNWINDLKLRASWGKLGNDRVDQFQYLSTFNMQDGAILGETPVLNKGFVAGRIGNPDITWERVDARNIGLDARLWNGLLNFTAEYFIQKRKNILTQKQASIPSYTGLTLPDQNIGKVNNSGYEIVIGHRNTIGKVRYNVNFNVTYAKNEIKYFDEAANVPTWQRRTGYPMDSWLMYKTDGIYQTQSEIDNSPHFSGARPGDIKYVDIDGDGKITSNDRYRDYINNIPQYVFGLNTGFTWKGLEVNVLWTGQAKAKQMIIPYSYNTYKKIYDGRWISADKTPHAKYPAAFNKDDGMNTRYSDFWLYNASFIRLKNVEIAYNFSQNFVKRMSMQNVRLYLMGTNLFTIDHIGFEDPETSAVNAGQYYPQQRVYTIGMNISF